MLRFIHIAPGQEARSVPASGDLTLPDEGYLWIDLQAPTPEEAAVLRSPVLGIDPMLVEDILDDRHLPKVDLIGEHLLLTVHAIDLQDAASELDTTELDIVLGHRVVVTYHLDDVGSIRSVRSQLERRGTDRLDRPVMLVHRILDVMNDIFVPFVDLLERRIDVIEEDVLSNPTAETRREIYAVQRDVIQLRRAVVPQAEVVRRVGRMPSRLIDDADLPLFRDIHDHLYRMAQLSDSYHQLLDSALQSYQSAVDADLNQMLRVLTLINAVLLPIAVLAGIFGMNFEHMPELQWRWSYPTVWLVFVLIAAGQVWAFRRAGWLGRRAEREAHKRRLGLPSVLEIPLLGHVLRVPVSTARAVTNAGRSLTRPRHRDDKQ